MELRKELESSTNSLEGYCSTIELPQQFIKVEILQTTKMIYVNFQLYREVSRLPITLLLSLCRTDLVFNELFQVRLCLAKYNKQQLLFLFGSDTENRTQVLGLKVLYFTTKLYRNSCPFWIFLRRFNPLIDWRTVYYGVPFNKYII